jgi:(1->4)-alpha-D-glucan 1-alpha-D-glucosylmutase
MAEADSGLPKLWVISAALELRARRPGVFEGGYEPLAAEGRRADHVVAFTRDGEVAVVVPRFPLRLAGNWQSTTVAIPEGDWANELTGETLRGGAVPMAALLQRFPVALLARG